MNKLLIMKTGDVEKSNIETNLDILITGNIGMKEFKEIVATIKEKNANEYKLQFGLGEDYMLIANIGKTVNKTEIEAHLMDKILYKDAKEIIEWYLK